MVELDDGVVGPQLQANLVTQYHLAGVIEEHEQNSPGLLAELDADALLAQFSGANVEFKRPEAKKARLRGAVYRSYRSRVLRLYAGKSLMVSTYYVLTGRLPVNRRYRI